MFLQFLRYTDFSAIHTRSVLARYSMLVVRKYGCSGLLVRSIAPACPVWTIESVILMLRAGDAKCTAKRRD